MIRLWWLGIELAGRAGLDGRLWVGEDRWVLWERDRAPPDHIELVARSEGARKGCVPMAMVWPTGLDVDGYVAAGRELVVPRQCCPGCGGPMVFWGWYERDVRVTGVVRRVLVRRVRCPDCAATHALLPGFVTWGRLDAVEVIGPALEAMCGGVGMRRVAAALDVAHTTVRDWRRRFCRRAAMLAVGLCRYVVAVGDLAPRLSGPPELVALAAARSAWAAARRRFGAGVGGRWRVVNLVVGGHLLSTNTDPPFAGR